MSKIKILACFLFLAFPLIAKADIVRNGTSSYTSQDTISIVCWAKDSLASMVPIDTTADWLKIIVYNPNGDSVFSDSTSIVKASNTKIDYHMIAAKVGTVSYAREVEDIDGGGRVGFYTMVAQVRDSSLKLSSQFMTRFQIVPQGGLAEILDSAADATNVLDTIKTYDNSGRFQLNVQEILDTLKTYDNSGRFQLLVQEILDSIKVYDNAGHAGAIAQEVLDTIKTYDNAGRFQLLVKEILDTLQTYDSDTRSWGANLLKMLGVSQSATDLTDFADAGYDPSTDRVLADAHAIDADTTAADQLADGFDTDSSTYARRFQTRQIEAVALGANTSAMYVEGTGAGSGLAANGKYGIYAQSGTSGGAGIRAEGAVGNAEGFYGIGIGTGSGARFEGGLSGAGLRMKRGSNNSTGMGDITLDNNDADSGYVISSFSARETADSVWEDRIAEHKADSVFGGAYGYVPGGTRAVVIVDGDSAVGGFNVKAADTITVVNNVLNIASTDTLALVNNVANINSADTLQLVNVVGSTDAGDTLRAHAPHGNNFASTGASSLTPDSIRDIIGDTLNAVGGKLLTDAGDSIRAHAPHDNNWGATATIVCNGSGLVSCTLDVRNASGGLGGVDVGIYNTSNTFLYGDQSDASGFVYFNLDASTTYRVKAGGLAGSVHDSLPYQTLGIGAVTHKRDTIPMTTSSIAAPSAANLTRIYTYEDDGAGGRLSGVKIYAVLLLPSDSMSATKIAFDTATGVAYGANTEVVDSGMTTNVNGYAHVDLTRNDFISPGNTRWQVWAEYKKQTRWSVILNITSGGSQCIQQALNGGSCP